MSENLEIAPDTLENLKFILTIISNIRDMSLSVEMRNSDIQERYRTLALYKLKVSFTDSHLEIIVCLK